MEEVSSVPLRNDDGHAEVGLNLTCNIPAPSEIDRSSLHQGTDDDSDEAETFLGLSQPVDPVEGVSFPLQSLSSPRSQHKSDCDEESYLKSFGVPSIRPQKARLGSQRYSLGKNPDDFPQSGTWKEKLYEYCQGASIHGLKQITEPQPLKSRRSELFLFSGSCWRTLSRLLIK